MGAEKNDAGSRSTKYSGISTYGLPPTRLVLRYRELIEPHEGLENDRREIHRIDGRDTVHVADRRYGLTLNPSEYVGSKNSLNWSMNFVDQVFRESKINCIFINLKYKKSYGAAEAEMDE